MVELEDGVALLRERIIELDELFFRLFFLAFLDQGDGFLQSGLFAHCPPAPEEQDSKSRVHMCLLVAGHVHEHSQHP